MTNEETKTIRIITQNGTVELTGTPEELAQELNKRYDNVIQFPLRGIHAHPSNHKNPTWGSE